jgi:predicted metal-dependent phosphoesterase TrpH
VIDLHSHTSESDGTDSPAELLGIARQAGLRTLAITDHDTFSGYDAALPLAEELDLLCGVELSCRHGSKTVHLLAYFPRPAGAPPDFRAWVDSILISRRERNVKLIDRLRSLEVDITLQEVEAVGRSVTGRPHFAQVLVKKGYAADRNDAFHRWIGEESKGFVERIGPTLPEAISQIRLAGGVSSLAHPVRVGLSHKPEEELTLLAELRDAGLDALEVFHSDQGPALVDRYFEWASLLGLLKTGGSDYHGGNKPGIALGSVRVPPQAVEALREFAACRG